ncbi:MAG: IS1595 family transposase [Sneathiellales bacterium]|nr:IS1595 family transposase [Sneathiellales bacterium]
MFSDTSGTYLYRKRIPPRELLLTLYELSQTKSITSGELGKKLGFSQKRAWNILHCLRQYAATLKHITPDSLRGVVESDEAWIGRGRNTTILQGLVQRAGKIVLLPIPDCTEKVLKGNIKKFVEKFSSVMTDSAVAYGGLSCSGYYHQTVNHSKNEFSRGNGIHSNTIEGFWGNLKKVLYGIHHGVLRHNLGGYTAEFALKYNLRHSPSLFSNFLYLFIAPPLTC